MDLQVRHSRQFRQIESASKRNYIQQIELHCCMLYSLNVRERSLGENRLSDNTRESHHGQTSVCELFHLHCVDLLLGLALHKVEWVEAEVSWLTSRSLQHLNDSKTADDLGERYPKENLAHATLLHNSIVSSDRGKSFVSLRERVDLETDVHGNKSNIGQHAHTTVFQLGLAKKVHWNEVGEAKRIERSLIAYVSSQVFWVWKEREGGTLLGTERRSKPYTKGDEERTRSSEINRPSERYFMRSEPHRPR